MPTENPPPILSAKGDFIFWEELVFDTQDGSIKEYPELAEMLTGAKQHYFVGANGRTFLYAGSTFMQIELSDDGAEIFQSVTTTENVGGIPDEMGVTPEGKVWTFYSRSYGGSRRGDAALYWKDLTGRVLGSTGFGYAPPSLPIAIDQNHVAYICGTRSNGIASCAAHKMGSDDMLWVLDFEQVGEPNGGALAPGPADEPGRLYVSTKQGHLYAIGPGQLAAPPAELEQIAQQAQDAPQETNDSSESDDKIDVGGYQLYLNCTGQGQPTVVSDAGFRETSATWELLQPEIAKHTRVCSYDRAGLGQSDPRLAPQVTSQGLAGELHTLLHNAGVEGPFILVGHSLAGLHLRLFADQYADETAGLVMVDCAHPEQNERMLTTLPPESPDESKVIQLYRALYSGAFDDMPEMNPENYNFGSSGDQVRAVESLGDLPLILLTAADKSRDPELPDEYNAKFDAVWLQLQRELAQLSSNSLHIITYQSGHYIHKEQPKLVIDAILQLVEPAISGQTLLYSLSVVNNGPSDARDVLVTDTLPGGVTFDSAVTSRGSGCSESAGIITCALGDLANGEAVTITVRVTPLISSTTVITNTAVVGSSENDPNQNNNLTIHPTLLNPSTTISPTSHAPTGYTVECGDLIVLENRRQANGPAMRIHAAIFKSSNPNPALDPVIYLAGGGANQLDSRRSWQ